MDFEIIKIRVNDEVRIRLEEYLVREGLHRDKIRTTQLLTEVVREWIKKPVLNDRLILKFPSKTRGEIVGIKINEEENIKLNEIFVSKYIRKCRTLNVLLYNIVLQFLDKNFDDFDILTM